MAMYVFEMIKETDDFCASNPPFNESTKIAAATIVLKFYMCIKCF